MFYVLCFKFYRSCNRGFTDIPIPMQLSNTYTVHVLAITVLPLLRFESKNGNILYDVSIFRLETKCWFSYSSSCT